MSDIHIHETIVMIQSNFNFFRKSDLFRALIESGIQFQIEAPILTGKGFFLFFSSGDLRQKHFFENNLV